jgi:hypothetical protein
MDAISEGCIFTDPKSHLHNLLNLLIHFFPTFLLYIYTTYTFEVAGCAILQTSGSQDLEAQIPTRYRYNRRIQDR